ncbi:hypothetical protein T484DRAFT_1810388 [Baffinella frigidus]|nr:hypothetical protein T484DRAFT_1810388 [Cryptophyta sp. CCMP2293]
MPRKSHDAPGEDAGGGKRRKQDPPVECCPECQEPVRERREGVLYWQVPDGAEAAPCGCAYCVGCLLAGILARLPYTFKCSTPGCGERVKSWLRVKAAPTRGAANKDTSLRVGVKGGIAGGREKGAWILPSAVLEYFTASREKQLSGSALCVLGIDDLDASIRAEATTQRFVRVLGTGEVESAGEEGEQHRRHWFYAPWVATQLL